MAPDSAAGANTLPLSPDTTDGHLWPCLWTWRTAGVGGWDGFGGASTVVASAADDVAAMSSRRSCPSLVCCNGLLDYYCCCCCCRRRAEEMQHGLCPIGGVVHWLRHFHFRFRWYCRQCCCCLRNCRIPWYLGFSCYLLAARWRHSTYKKIGQRAQIFLSNWNFAWLFLWASWAKLKTKGNILFAILLARAAIKMPQLFTCA